MSPGEAPYDVLRGRERCNFTTHTPVESGQDKFSYKLVKRVLGDFIDFSIVKSLAGKENLPRLFLPLIMSEHINGVARRHAEMSNRIFTGYHVEWVPNGVYPFSWAHPGWKSTPSG
jgi:starch phosphorylase